jgi:methylphosphotriester-DNA--protein-cysteine methyltransferase
VKSLLLALTLLTGTALFPQAKAPQEIVYVTKTGKKFHRSGCSSLRSSAIPMTRAQAIAKGYAPCQKCNP